LCNIIFRGTNWHNRIIGNIIISFRSWHHIDINNNNNFCGYLYPRLCSSTTNTLVRNHDLIYYYEYYNIGCLKTYCGCTMYTILYYSSVSSTTTTQLYRGRPTIYDDVIFRRLSQIKILSSIWIDSTYVYIYILYMYDTYTCAYGTRIIPSGYPRTAWQVYRGGYIGM